MLAAMVGAAAAMIFLAVAVPVHLRRSANRPRQAEAQPSRSAGQAPALPQDPIARAPSPATPTGPNPSAPGSVTSKNETKLPRDPSSAQADPVAAVRAEIEALDKESLDIADSLVRDYPEASDPLAFLGMVHARFGRMAEAWPCWEKALARDPARADVYRAMATAALGRGEYNKAAQFCRDGLAKSAGISDLHLQLAKAMVGLGKPEEAVPELELAIQALPNDEENYLLLGQAYSLLKDYAKARTNYERAVKLKPSDQQAHYGLAITCVKLRLQDESKRSMERYQKCAADFMTMLRSRRDVSYDVGKYRYYLALTCCEAAMIYAGHQRTDKGEELLRKAAKLEPRNTFCLFLLAKLLYNTGRGPEAVGVVKDLLAIEPQQALYYRLLCQIEARLDRRDDAIAAAKKAIELDPDNAEYRRLLEQLEARR
jgi:cytochrome c-type biogenesis protein CcmH/NrfG